MTTETLTVSALDENRNALASYNTALARGDNSRVPFERCDRAARTLAALGIRTDARGEIIICPCDQRPRKACPAHPELAPRA